MIKKAMFLYLALAVSIWSIAQVAAAETVSENELYLSHTVEIGTAYDSHWNEFVSYAPLTVEVWGPSEISPGKKINFTLRLLPQNYDTSRTDPTTRTPYFSGNLNILLRLPDEGVRLLSLPSQ